LRDGRVAPHTHGDDDGRGSSEIDPQLAQCTGALSHKQPHGEAVSDYSICLLHRARLRCPVIGKKTRTLSFSSLRRNFGRHSARRPGGVRGRAWGFLRLHRAIGEFGLAMLRCPADDHRAVVGVRVAARHHGTAVVALHLERVGHPLNDGVRQREGLDRPAAIWALLLPRLAAREE